MSILAATCLLCALGAAPASAFTPEEEAKLCLVGEGAKGFGFCEPQVSFEKENGEAEERAGVHPFAMNTYVRFRHHFEEAESHYTVDEDLRDFFGTQLAGLAGDADAYPRCTTADFLTNPGLHDSLYSETACNEDETAVGAAVSGVKGYLVYSPLLNLEPPAGVAARLGWDAAGLKVILDIVLKRGGEYNIVARQRNLPQIFPVIGAKVQVWGVPADPRHDEIRGRCLSDFLTNGTGSVPDLEFHHGSLYPGLECPSPQAESPKPLLTLPTRCGVSLPSLFAIDSWLHPAAFTAEGEPDLADPGWVQGSWPTPPFTGCGRLTLSPEAQARPTSRAAVSPSGLDFTLRVPDPGLANPSDEAAAASQIEKTVVTLPRGMTLNPSQAEGLEVCSEADLARETLAAEPGEGCPQASKIGTVEDENPLVSQTLKGSIFVAEPYANLAGDSLIAIYVVIRNRELGVLVKQPIEIEPDAQSGQLVAISEDMPQLPLGTLRLHFREGGRSPLITPPACGAFQASALFYPYSGGPLASAHPSFEIVSGPGEGPCPSGTPPFGPGFQAGSANNAAGRYSPFSMRLTRKDGEQDMSKFSFVLPPGVVPKLAGIPYCSDAAIARAASRTGPHGGAEERSAPSCPAASQIGRTVAGAGVGGQLTYVPGRLYLAGPYHGDPISAVSITPALAGPFDAGTVVVREGLRLDPVTHLGEVDGAASDPIPHILKGIPLNVRELQVYADRSQFTRTPTSCASLEARTTIWGAGTALAPLAESPVGLRAPYQAAECRALGFKPRLGLRLRGGTRRGAFPALRAVYTPRQGAQANLSSLALLFPRSEFIEQGHFRTICTRVQFAAGPGFGAQCPKGSVYGHVSAWSPLLDQPLEGPVYLRSSSHNLPDAVFALHGLVDVEVSVRIDSVHGRLRARVQNAPDALISRAVVRMQGGQKGLFVNSTDICAAKHRARANAVAQNGRRAVLHPLLRPSACAKHRRHRGHRRR